MLDIHEDQMINVANKPIHYANYNPGHNKSSLPAGAVPCFSQESSAMTANSVKIAGSTKILPKTICGMGIVLMAFNSVFEEIRPKPAWAAAAAGVCPY